MASYLSLLPIELFHELFFYADFATIIELCLNKLFVNRLCNNERFWTSRTEKLYQYSLLPKYYVKKRVPRKKFNRFHHMYVNSQEEKETSIKQDKSISLFLWYIAALLHIKAKSSDAAKLSRVVSELKQLGNKVIETIERTKPDSSVNYFLFDYNHQDIVVEASDEYWAVAKAIRYFEHQIKPDIIYDVLFTKFINHEHLVEKWNESGSNIDDILNYFRNKLISLNADEYNLHEIELIK